MLAAGVCVCTAVPARVRLVAGLGVKDESTGQLLVKRAIWAVVSLVGVLAFVLGALGVWSASASTVSGPSLGRTIELAPVSGQVFVRLPGASHSMALVHQMVVPVGSRVDATRGTVDLTSEGPARAGLQKGVFDGGVFIVQQPRSGQTILIQIGRAHV